MRALFLDIDGVLTSARAHAALAWDASMSLIWHHFDPIAIGFLNRLSKEEPDLCTVLSSSWRHIWEIRDMTMMLSQAGWKGTWHSNWKTPSFSDGSKVRGHEIQAWCQEHKPERYVILDDDADMLIEQSPHFVQTDSQNGMNKLEYFLAAKRCLKRKVATY